MEENLRYLLLCILKGTINETSTLWTEMEDEIIRQEKRMGFIQEV